ADQIAKEAQFFSFGTNDLTQTTLGMSRDDYGSFIRRYIDPPKVKDDQGNEVLLPQMVCRDPFQTIAVQGVAGRVRVGVEEGRSRGAAPKSGFGGQHGGGPDPAKSCHKSGLNCVSCRPFRVPIARLAAAQATLGKK